MIKPRVGLIVPYVTFYEKIAAVGAEKREFARHVAERLHARMDVVDCGLVTTEEEAAEAGRQLSQASIDAVVVAPAVATFGALGWAAASQFREPICLWNIQPDDGVSADYDIGKLIRNSGGLGTQALANTLAREDRPYIVAFSTEQDSVPGKLIRFAEAAAVWNQVKRARFGRIGTVFESMTDIAMSAEKWPGTPIVSIPAAGIAEAYRRPAGIEVTARVSELQARHTVEEITDEELYRSARLSLALDTIVREHALDGGAFNCHGENCLQNKEIGVTACYGVSRQTSEGRPFSCTGDLPTAIGMKILQELAGPVIYGELDLVDRERDIVLLANGGEGHFGAAIGPVSIAGNENFAGLHGRGASLRFTPFQGSATILSFTPLAGDSRYRIIAAQGTLEAAPPTGLGVFHAAFRFSGLPAVAAYEKWCEAGAVHHIAIAPGGWVDHLQQLALLSGFELIEIGGNK